MQDDPKECLNFHSSIEGSDDGEPGIWNWMGILHVIVVFAVFSLYIMLYKLFLLSM